MIDLIIKERELKENLVKEINDSKIPPFIIRYILKDLLSQTDLLVEQQYNEAKAQKEQMIKEIEKIEKKGESK